MQFCIGVAAHLLSRAPHRGNIRSVHPHPLVCAHLRLSAVWDSPDSSVPCQRVLAYCVSELTSCVTASSSPTMSYGARCRRHGMCEMCSESQCMVSIRGLMFLNARLSAWVCMFLRVGRELVSSRSILCLRISFTYGTTPLCQRSSHPYQEEVPLSTPNI